MLRRQCNACPLFGSGIPSWRQILRAGKSAISECLGTVVSARFRICYAWRLRRRERIRTAQVSNELSPFHLYLELLDDDLSLGKFRQIYRLSDHFDAINQIFADLFQGLALCERARNIICPSNPPYSILHKTGLDLHKIVSLLGILRESESRSQPASWQSGDRRATAKSARSGFSGARSPPGRSLIPPTSFERHGSTLPKFTGLGGFVTTKNSLHATAGRSSRFGSIRKSRSCKISPDAVEQVKPQTPRVDARPFRNSSGTSRQLRSGLISAVEEMRTTIPHR
jgi:hypothetical protein